MTIHWRLISPNDFYEDLLRSVTIAIRPVVRISKELGSGMTPETLKPNVPPPPPVVGDPSPPGMISLPKLTAPPSTKAISPARSSPDGNRGPNT